ncbi:hypothetical protein AMECASPLE_037363 [Ameca splendens]|uniref:Uncharacterized protein n=1 Tax=Ameca splendens TaxID=208324 RepID=A0ABV0XL42_9TELE
MNLDESQIYLRIITCSERQHINSADLPIRSLGSRMICTLTCCGDAIFSSRSDDGMFSPNQVLFVYRIQDLILVLYGLCPHCFSWHSVTFHQHQWISGIE